MKMWGKCAAFAATVVLCHGFARADYLTVQDPIFSSPMVALTDLASTMYGTEWSTYDPYPREYPTKGSGYFLNVNDIVWQNPAVGDPKRVEVAPADLAKGWLNLTPDLTITQAATPDPGNWPYAGCASISSTNGNEFSQSLPSVYQVNQSYRLIVAVGHNYDYGDPVGYAPPVDSALRLELFYTDANGRHIVTSTDILNDAANALASDHMLDFSTPLVDAPADAVGKSIGILLTTVNPASGETSGFFNFTNVRVEAVPEPASLAVMLAGSMLLMRRRRT